MTVYLSCGHKAASVEEGVVACIKSHSGPDRAILHSVVCDRCFQFYKAESVLLESEEDESRWLSDILQPNEEMQEKNAG